MIGTWACQWKKTGEYSDQVKAITLSEAFKQFVTSQFNLFIRFFFSTKKMFKVRLHRRCLSHRRMRLRRELWRAVLIDFLPILFKNVFWIPFVFKKLCYKKVLNKRSCKVLWISTQANKLECLSLRRLFSVAYYLWGRPVLSIVLKEYI